MKYYLYDPDTKIYIAEVNKDYISQYGPPPNSTDIKPPKVADDKYLFFSEQKNEWSVYPKVVATKDNGWFMGTLELPVPEQGWYDCDYVIEIPEVKEGKEYYYDNGWYECEFDWEDFVQPRYDVKAKKVVEDAPIEEVNQKIDRQTYGMIKSWCYENGLAEEQLIFKAIEDKNDPDYLAYKQAKQEIISRQKEKKVDTERK